MHGKSNADSYGQQLAAEVLLCLVIQRGSLHSVLDWVRMARTPTTQGVMISVTLLNQVCYRSSRVYQFNTPHPVYCCGIDGIKRDLLDQDAAGLREIQMDWGIARVMSL